MNEPTSRADPENTGDGNSRSVRSEIDHIAARIQRLITAQRTRRGAIEQAVFTVDFNDLASVESFEETLLGDQSTIGWTGHKMDLHGDYAKFWMMKEVDDVEKESPATVVFEVAPEWMRVYVDDETEIRSVAKFLHQIQLLFNAEFQFPAPAEPRI